MDFRLMSVCWTPLPLASSAVASDNCCATTGSMVISPVSVFHDARMPGPGLATVTTSSLGSAGFWTARRLRCTKDRAAARAALPPSFACQPLAIDARAPRARDVVCCGVAAGAAAGAAAGGCTPIATSSLSTTGIAEHLQRTSPPGWLWPPAALVTGAEAQRQGGAPG